MTTSTSTDISTTSAVSQTIALTKHHGLGNDFLVTAASVGDGAATARRLCDRRRGIGADGLLFLGRPDEPDVDLSMVLFNADGSRAEMSGNGIRCLAQAAYRIDGRQDSAEYRVLTDGGVRRVVVTPTDDPDTVWVDVEMGPVESLSEPDGWSDLGVDPMRPVLHLSLGNPHSVVAVDDVDGIDLLGLGRRVPHVNLEVVETGARRNEITMRVHERGAGLTEACGTGACASGWAARHWGLVDATVEEIVVQMPGGAAKVRLDSPRAGEVTLIGPAMYVGTVTV